MKRKYYSALKGNQQLGGLEQTNGPVYDNLGNVVFRHDITIGIHPLFKGANVIYIEPPWKDGYEEFNGRAGINTALSYNDYLETIKKVIIELNKPSVCIMGKHMQQTLSPDLVIDIKLHNYKCLAGLWKIELGSDNPKDSYSLIEILASKYNRVLDFCCGYGNTGLIFKDHGKRFIMSDLNGRCVAYVATEIMGTK